MVVMALDHARAFFTFARFNPLDHAVTTPEYYITRWITHFAAPVFVFFAGTAAFLSGSRGRVDLPRFLWTRGLWLVVVEMTFVHVGWFLDLNFGTIIAQVIWAIGWSMVALSFLVRFGPGVVGAIGLAILALHNLADPLVPAHFGPFDWLWKMLHERGAVEPVPGLLIRPGYPVLPWFGVMAAGYGLGRLFTGDRAMRDRALVAIGLSAVALFLVLRASQVYGDPGGWSDQGDPVRTAMDFMNVQKYPPSLLFLLATLGPALAILPALDRAKGAWSRIFVTFGRVPLFYYVLHLWILRLLVPVFAVVVGHDWRPLVGVFFAALPPTWGFDLPVVYAVWIGVVLLLYPLCAWFADVKRRRKDWWLSYL